MAMLIMGFSILSNCFLYLAHNSEEDLLDFDKSLNLLYINYLKDHPCDVLVFYENTFEQYIDQFCNNHPDIKFVWQKITFDLPNYPVDIKTQIPVFFPHPTHGNGPVGWGHPGFSMGYRHMCRFFSGAMYEDRVLQGYEYYCRLDTDSFILEKIPYNIFEYAQKHNIFYGYIKDAVQMDNMAVAKNFGKTALNFLKESGIRDINLEPENKMYYTNFEIGYVPFFRSGIYKDFFDYIDRSGGIYIYRWGDAIVKYMGISLSMKPENRWAITDIVYQHGAIYNK